MIKALILFILLILGIGMIKLGRKLQDESIDMLGYIYAVRIESSGKCLLIFDLIILFLWKN